MSQALKNLHLLISAIVVFLAAIVYGGNPEVILPLFFDFEVHNLELKNIFRAVGGLYIAFAGYWIYGLWKPSHWRSATISNVLFMSGLVFGRTVSTLLDGVSTQYTIGLSLELLMVVWGLYNLKQESGTTK